MPQFEIEVVEVRHVSVTYVVEADDAKTAIEKAQKGETVSEADSGIQSVEDRHVQVNPDELKPIPEEDEIDAAERAADHEDLRRHGALDLNG